MPATGSAAALITLNRNRVNRKNYSKVSNLERQEKMKERVEPVRKPLPAPDWLVERMDKVSKLPPPTLEEVIQQFESSDRWRKENLR